MRRTILLALLVFQASLAIGQTRIQTYKPVASDGQSLWGPSAQEQGYFGIGVSLSPDENGKAIFVTKIIDPGSPGDRAGLRIGDVIDKIDGQIMARMPEERWIGSRFVKPGDTIQVTYRREGIERTVSVTAEPYTRLHPEALKGTPAVSQFIWSDGVLVMASLDRTPDGNHVALWLTIYNKYVKPFTIDEGKIFILNGKRQQLRRVSLGEQEYAVRVGLERVTSAQGRPLSPPPPPPPQQYKIVGSEEGTYTFMGLGTQFPMVSSQSSITYTVVPQPDYSQLAYSFGLALRSWAQWRQQAQNEKLAESAQQVIELMDKYHLRTETPILAEENRSGDVWFWAGPDGMTGPFKVVLLLTAPVTGQETQVVFEFLPETMEARP